MVVITGISIIIVLLALILSKRVSALTALIVVPVMGALIAGFGMETMDFAIEGIKAISPVVAMFVFAILFFGILTDAGMFDPLIKYVVDLAGRNPVKITIGTAILAMLIHLDGSGAVTFLVVVPAMLPLYDELGMDRKVLACVVALGAGTMNMVPWGGPTIRAATALQVDITELYNPLIIPQLAGLSFVLLVSAFLGKKEAARLGKTDFEVSGKKEKELHIANDSNIKRPNLFWINIMLTIGTISALISGLLPPAIIFMGATILALVINYPDLTDQNERINAHAKACLLMATILLGAGVFTGVMKESGMISAMADQLVKIIPGEIGMHIPVLMAFLSMPLSFVFDPDSFYFGFMPIMAEASGEMGIAPVKVAQASLLGQMTTGFPLSPLTATTFLLVGLTGVDLADHQRYTFKYAFLTTIIMTMVAILIGVLPV